ncbi:porin [uncultured Shewanella sp.]|uniref:porin n=1 Tax=uncultured Shewanella sp. TaxID=173975 RepID=UPI002638ED8A|nr:porin [uncultured Shewanella sp.]
MPYSTYASKMDVFGSMNTAITQADQAFATSSKVRGTSIENATKLGVEGEESITNKTQLLYKISFKIYNASPSGDKTPIKASSTYLGISNPLGTLLIGRNNTVFKSTATNIDIFNHTDASLSHLIAGQVRSPDSISYYSPILSSLLTFNGTYLMSTNQKDNLQSNAHNLFAFAVNLGDPHLHSRPYFYSLSYNRGIGNIDAFRWISQIKWRAFILSELSQYSQSRIMNEQNMKGCSHDFNLSYRFGRLQLNAEYGLDSAGLGDYFYYATGGSDTDKSTISDVNISQVALGAQYQLSRSTKLYCLDTLYQGQYKDRGTLVTLNSDNIVSVGIDYHF